MKQTAAIYARYSSHAQDGGTSIEVQLDACRRGAEGANVREYIDRARTGRAVVGRDSLLKLLADAEAGEINRILVYKYDRLGRNLAETSAIIAQLEDGGVEVVSVTEGKDALARGMYLVISEHYSRVLSERTRDGLKKRFEQGAWTGGPPPYGYAIEKTESGLHRLKVNPEEAEVVRFIFTTYVSESVGLRQIANRLRDRGVPTRRGPFWAHVNVRQILTNDICIGRLVYNRRRFKINKHSGKRVPVWRDEADHMVHQDESLRIIDDALWQRVQDLIASRARKHCQRGQFRGGQVRPFTGLIFCEECGNVCYRVSSRNHKGQYHYYKCGCRQRGGDEACPSRGWVREDLLVEEMRQTWSAIFADTDAVVEEAIREARRVLDDSRERLQKTRAEIARLDKKVAGLTKLLMDPEIDAAAKKAVSRQMGELEAERERQQQLVAELASAAHDNTDRLAGAVRQALAEAQESLFAVTTPAEMRGFLERHVGPMYLTTDGRIIPPHAARKPANKKSSAPVETEAEPKLYIAGACYAQFHAGGTLAATFWLWFRRVA